MAQSGYTPISLYHSTTAAASPSAGNLVAGELALNTTDEKLYFKNTAGTVKQIAGVGVGGITYTTVKTANYTAINNDGVQTNTTAGAFTVTLPATPSNGNQVFVVDSFNTWGTNNLTIGRNGSTIEGSATDLICDITGVSVQCIYNGTTWDIFAQVGGAGGSVVSGPASSTDNAFARFDGTTGKIIQNSTGATLSDTGAAVFTGALDVLGDSTAGSNLKLYEDTDNGTNYVSFKAPNTIASNVTWTLPSADGTSAQVLQTNGSGTLSFATPSSGDLVLVQTSSFSGVANTSTTFDGVFTSTYKSYRVVCRQFFGSVTTTLPVMNLRTGGTTNSGSNHNYYYTVVTGAGATSVVAANSSTNWLMPPNWVSIGSASSWYMDFTGVGASYQEILASFSGLANATNSWYSGGVRWEGSATTFDGFIITATNGTITGTVDVYGYK